MLILADAKIPFAETAFKPFGEVRVVPTRQMTHETVKDATAILVRSETKIDAALLNGTKIRFVGTATIGTDHVDLEYLKSNNIGFSSCPGSNANSVAEYVLAALLELGVRFEIALKGKTLGVVGHGNTGSRVAKKAEAIGMKVLLNDPPLARTTHDPQYVPLDALMSADFISLHVPLTKIGDDATYHLFDERRLSAMKHGSILINASRGAVVSSEALKSVLRSNHLRASVLDVWEKEPIIDCDLLHAVALGSPHIAGYSFDGKLNATTMLQYAIGEFFRVAVPQHAEEKTEELVEIPLPEVNADMQALIRHAVKHCYDIEEDDRMLRGLLALAPADRGEYFRTLRSGYRTRREFHNSVIDVTNLDDESRTALSAVGFTINDLKDAA